jgi:cytidylate kinase
MAEQSTMIAGMRAVTLSREYGSGGGEIANHLARRLGWQVVDHEVVVQVAQQLHVSEADAEAFDEVVESRATRILNSLRLLQPMMPVIDVPQTITSRAFYEARGRVIEGAVATGAVVIVGRGAQAHLAGRRDVFHVRIVAPLEARIAYVMRREGRDEAGARERITRKDEERRRYLQAFYQQDPRDAHLYDIVLNTGIIDLGSAVDIIYLALERKARRLAAPAHELGPIAGLAPYPGPPEDFRPPK